MFDLPNKLGAKSYSFRHIANNRDVAAAIRICNLAHIDLSACHVNYDSTSAQDEVIAIYREAGISICGIGVVNCRNDEVFTRRYFDFAHRAGTREISISFGPEDFVEIIALLEKLSEEYDCRLAIHNHGGRHWLGNGSMLSYLMKRTSERIGICLDTAWAIQAGYAPEDWIKDFGARLYGIHFKDFSFDAKGRFKDAIVGQGALDLPGFLAKFRELPFTGSAVVEYEGENAIDATAQSAVAIRSLWK